MKCINVVAGFAVCMVASAAWSKQAPCASYAEDLKAMVVADQAIRAVLSATPPVRDLSKTEDIPRILRHAGIVDETNTARLKAYLQTCGWPKRSQYGEAASRNAWLLAQHADRDRAFQREVLALLEPLVATGEVAGQSYAYLRDRVAVAEGRPQLYGTQLSAAGACIFGFKPMDDRERVEQRRKEIGLPTLDQYLDVARRISKSKCAVNAAP